MAQQIGQHVEDLRLQVDDLAAASQLDALDAQLAITESNPHTRHGASRTARCSNRAVRLSGCRMSPRTAKSDGKREHEELARRHRRRCGFRERGLACHEQKVAFAWLQADVRCGGTPRRYR